MNQHTRFLDRAQAERGDELARRNAEYRRGRVLMEYIGGALITMGWYCDSKEARAAYSEVGKWIELGDRTDNWRSENGRVLVLSDTKWAPGAP